MATSPEQAARVAVTTLMYRHRLPWHRISIITDIGTGEFSHIVVAVRTVGEAARWQVAINGGQEHVVFKGSEWFDVYGEVEGYRLHVSTDHRELEPAVPGGE